MRRLRQRGSIVMVLVVSTLALVLTATVVGLASHSTRQSHDLEHSQRARTAAENTMALALAELQRDPAYGTPGSSGASAVLSWDSQVRAGQASSSGSLTFSSAEAGQLEIAVSLNNLEGEEAVQGWNREVPPRAAQLVAVGRCGAMVRTVECLVSMDDFPYVVAASSEVNSSGPLLVGQIPEGASPSGLTMEDLLPGHMVGNADLNLGGPTTVIGDLQAAGEIEGDSIEVRGERRPNDAPAVLPEMRAEDFRPDFAEPYLPAEPPLAIAGYYEHEGDLLVDSDTDFHNGMLFVDGDVEITGQVRGAGAIVATGSVTLRNHNDLDGLGKMAIVSDGALTIDGGDANSKFRGMLYSRDDIHLSDVTLVGSMVTNGDSSLGTPNASRGRVGLREANLYGEQLEITVSPVERVYCWDANTGEPCSPEHPRAQWMSAVAEQTGPDEVTITRQSYHPVTGLMDLGSGTVRISDGTVTSGDLSRETLGRAGQEVIDEITRHPDVGYYQGVRITPINALFFINVVSRHGEQLTEDFSWVTDAFASQGADQEIDFDFNRFIAPRDKLRIKDWNLYSTQS